MGGISGGAGYSELTLARISGRLMAGYLKGGVGGSSFPPPLGFPSRRRRRLLACSWRGRM
jgi:hypothetical protein